MGKISQDDELVGRSRPKAQEEFVEGPQRENSEEIMEENRASESKHKKSARNSSEKNAYKH